MAAERGSVAQTLALGVLVLVIAAGAGLLGAMATADRPDASTPDDAFVPIDTADAVRVLRMGCVENGADLESQAVKAQSDGVHVEITGATGESVFFNTSGNRQYQFTLRGAAPQRLALPLPPGSWRAVCSPSEGTPAAGAGAAFVVTDPNEVFVTSVPACSVDDMRSEVHPLPPEFVQDQEAVLRDAFGGRIQPNDLVERAGYPDAVAGMDPPNPLIFRVVRGSTIVASINAAEGNDGWDSEMIGCLGGEA